MEKSQMGSLGARLFALVFIGVGGTIIFFGVQTLLKANESTHWPMVEGTIVISVVDSKRGDENGTTYHAEVLYEYVIEKKTQSSNKIAFGSFGTSNPSYARRIVNKYPAGSKVMIYYSPKNYAESVLEPGITAKVFFLPCFGAVFLLVGLALFIFLPGQMLKQQAARSLDSRGK